MRRWLFVLGAATLLLAACGGGSVADGSGGVERALLLARSDDTLAAIDPDTGEIAYRARGGLAAGDGSVIFRTVPLDGGRTRLIGLDPGSGERSWAMALDGRLSLGAVSADGTAAALMPGEAHSAYSPQGRDRTTIVVARPGDSSVRTVELNGNLEPEAFTADGRGLFVIEYLPPMAPDRYQVRLLDLGASEVVDVYSVDKELQEAMGGTAHSQALAPDGSRLYTLYTVDGPNGREAFVHVLSLDQQWAHCVDLPASFAQAPEEAVALAASTDGRRLFVADLEGGNLAVVDTSELKTVSTSEFPGLAGERATAVVAERDRRQTLYAARGNAVLSIGMGVGARPTRWNVGSEVSGLQLSPGGDRLYVATGDSVTVLAARTGRTLKELSLPIGPITQLGLGPPPLASSREVIKCAC